MRKRRSCDSACLMTAHPNDPRRSYQAIARAGHLSNLERPEEFNTLVGAFIRGVDSRS